MQARVRRSPRLNLCGKRGNMWGAPVVLVLPVALERRCAGAIGTSPRGIGTGLSQLAWGTRPRHASTLLLVFSYLCVADTHHYFRSSTGV